LIDAPAETVGTVEWINQNPDACWNCTDQVFCKHSGTVNYGMLDGHTKAYKPTWAYVDASNRGHWFFDLRPAPSEPPKIPVACR
jgi:prepilin-type processing-associated H-X9-DG protein